MNCGLQPTNFMNGILSYGIKRNTVLNAKRILLTGFVFLLLVVYLPAQDSLCPPVSRPAPELTREIMERQRGISRYLQENRGWIEIQRDFGNYVLNKGIPAAVNADKNRLELIFLLDAKKQTTDTFYVPWEWIRDEQLRVFNSTTNIQSGSSRQEYRVKLGSCLFSVKDNPAQARLFRDQLLAYQQLYLENWSGLDSFAYKLCMYRKSGDKKPVPEEQHRYMVQAETCTKLGRYHLSLLLLEKAISISPFTAPENYLNLAVLYAENNRYHSAIFTMRKYLQLTNDPDERKTAEQKLAEWDIILKN